MGMLLQSKNPQPRPNTISPAIAMVNVLALPTLKSAGRKSIMPMALVKMRPRGIAKHREQRHRVEDANQATRRERPAPAMLGRIRHVTREAAEDLPDINARLMHAHGARPREALMIIGDQRQRRRIVESLAD